jgi:hypothetical protein
MRGFLGVPIRVQGEIFGNLYLRHGSEPFDDDLNVVRVLATEAGIAIGTPGCTRPPSSAGRWCPRCRPG